jgi:hypothetical protein
MRTYEVITDQRRYRLDLYVTADRGLVGEYSNAERRGRVIHPDGQGRSSDISSCLDLLRDTCLSEIETKVGRIIGVLLTKSERRNT